jgi:putative transposase
MSSHRQILYQIVFGTKNRKPTIKDDQSEKLYKYIWGIVKEHRCQLYRINGVADHIHIASDLHPSISLADYIKNIKVASSLWMKESTLFPHFEGWQEGYGAFTYSIKEKDNLIEYIKNQKVHHQSESFYDEYKRLLVENGVQFDERYLL